MAKNTLPFMSIVWMLCLGGDPTARARTATKNREEQPRSTAHSPTTANGTTDFISLVIIRKPFPGSSTRFGLARRRAVATRNDSASSNPTRVLSTTDGLRALPARRSAAPGLIMVIAESTTSLTRPI